MKITKKVKKQKYLRPIQKAILSLQSKEDKKMDDIEIKYDSTEDTMLHINRVRELIGIFISK